MLNKENRINKDKDFDRAFKTGQSFYSQILGVKLAKNYLENNRFGILISTKISKKAVVRNHLRRQIREIIRQENPLLKVGHDLVFIALSGIVSKNFTELTFDIKVIFNKLKLYQSPKQTAVIENLQKKIKK